VLRVELATEGHDVLSVTGEATLAGQLKVELLDGFDPPAGASFEVLAAGSITGNFASASQPPGLPGRWLNVEYGTPGVAGPGTTVTVTVNSLAELLGFGDPDTVGFAGSPTDAELVDLNEDGDLDLAVAVPNEDPLLEGSVLVLVNAGTVGGEWQGFTGGGALVTVGREPTAVDAGLFDGDSLPDLAVSNSADDDVTALLNNGDIGGPQPFDRTDFPVEDPNPPPGDTTTEPVDVEVGDFDGQPGDDLVVAAAAKGTVVILANDGAGGFDNRIGWIPVGPLPCDIDPGDIDEDKDLDDFAVALCGSETVVVFRDPPEGYSDDTPGVSYGVGGSPTRLALGDLYLNGSQDIVTVNLQDDTVSVLKNAGDGTFTLAGTFDVGDMPRSIAIADLSPGGGDGDLDLALVADNALGETVVQILRNDTPPPPDNQTLILTPDEDVPPEPGEVPVLVKAGEVDDDPDQDLVVVGESTGAPFVGGGSPTGGGAAAGPAPAGLVSVRLNAAEPACPADCGTVNNVVDNQDLQALLNQWGGLGPCDIAPLDGDGTVDILDLLDLLASWGQCP
jgi:hypothetical protein